MPTTTELTEKYLREHPSIKDCLKNNVINYSRLSRKIAKDLSIEKKTSMEAILIACRRFSLKIKNEIVLETKIIELLRKSELLIKTKILVAIIDKSSYMDHIIEIEKKIRKTADTFYIIEGTNSFTLVLSDKYEEEIRRLFKNNIIKIQKKLAMIIIKTDKDMETTPGVVNYLYSLYAEHGVNIIETMSCWTDTIFIIDEAEVSNVMSFLRFE